MTKAATPTISLKSFDARSASDTPFEFEYIHPDGRGSGLFLSVLGGQSKQVSDEVSRLLNERRRQDAARDAAAKAGGRQPADFTRVESDVEFGQRTAAIRIVGWHGIPEDYTPELALELCQSNADISSQVTQKSNDVGNFIRASSPT